MGTPLKPLRLLLSPKVLSPLSPTVHLSSKLAASRNQQNVAKRLDFNSAQSKFQSINVKINVTKCKTPPKQSLLINTPTKLNILQNGLKRSNNLNVLGRGTFGTVVRGIYKDENVAVKIIKTQSNVNELNALHLKHKNIVFYKDVIRNNEMHTIIIMEYLENSRQLQTLLDDDKVELSFRNVLHIAHDICNGLQYCHEKNVLHLDLKPANVLLCENGLSKICDFGNSFLLEKSVLSYNFEGTVAYTAPEILVGGKPTFATDVYSLGIIFWQMRHRLLPYAHLDNKDVVIYMVVKHNLRPSQSKNEMEDEYSSLYKSCWSSEEKNRPKLISVIEILNNLLDKEGIIRV